MNEKTTCNHVDRVALHSSFKLGGLAVGKCEREALPGMVMCAEHATPDAVEMAMQRLEAENKRLQAVVERVRHILNTIPASEE
jgi:hypothetical protein